MNIKELVNDYGHLGPFFGDGYSNHVPMVQSALFHLGYKESHIRTVSDYLVDKWALKAFEIEYRLDDFEEALGNRSAYLAYIEYFKKQADEKGLMVLVEDLVKKLKTGVSSMLFHGIIRLSYALMDDNEDEIIRALAFYACGFEAIEFTGKKIPRTVLRAEFVRFIQNREGYFYLSCPQEEKEGLILDAILELYLNTGSFIVLHTLTGYQALLSLKAYYDDFNQVLDRFMVCVERVLLRISQDDYKIIQVDHLKSFDEMIASLENVRDAHTIKFIYSSKVLYDLFGNENLLKAANVRFKESA